MNERILVVLGMAGGNDWLNTLIPMDEYHLYRNYRPNIGIEEQHLTSLGEGTGVSVHPSATAIKDLWEQGIVKIINQTHYPNKEKSHFRGTDLWLSGKDGNFDKRVAGSLFANYLSSEYPMYPMGFPNEWAEYPLGVSIGSGIPSLIWKSDEDGKMGINLKSDPNAFRRLVREVDQPSYGYDKSVTGDLIGFIDRVDNGGDSYSKYMADKYRSGKNLSNSYPHGRFSNNMKDIARSIAGGSETPVYYASDRKSVV